MVRGEVRGGAGGGVGSAIVPWRGGVTGSSTLEGPARLVCRCRAGSRGEEAKGFGLDFEVAQDGRRRTRRA